MCGIVGLHLRDRALEPQLGELLSDMLVTMTDRGPDSTGVAIYDRLPTTSAAVTTKYSCRSDDAELSWPAVASQHGLGCREGTLGAVLSGAGHLRDVLEHDAVRVMSAGVAIEVFKGVGPPRVLIEQTELRRRAGYQGVGHTRLATESAVTTDGSHPFSTHPDLCVVHNGSFSNYFTVRRDLEARGEEFQTENDTEVAARLIGRQLALGHTLREALDVLRGTLDGFYTLVCATRDEFAVARDSVGCKPAIIAEHERYVAMASEYRALAGLPDIARAHIFEPPPTTTHVWSSS